jgi:hypothetical protein
LRTVLLIALLLSSFFGIAHAATVSYRLNPIAGGVYEADFLISNLGTGIPIEEFTIIFELGRFQNVSLVDSPQDWDGVVIQPSPDIPDDGFADWLALGDALGADSALGGFKLSFEFLESGIPSSLPFSIIDPISFVELESGLATLSGISEVPTPGAFFLFAGSGMLLFRFVKRGEA